MNRFRTRLFLRALEDRITPATFTVLNLNDSGADSLRDCVSKANTAGGMDTVTFNGALSGTITLATSIAINDQINLVGTGKVTVSGGGSTLIFSIGGVSKGGQVILSDLTLANGSFVSNGGAIAGNDEALEVHRCTFMGNKAGGGGGAVFLQGGQFSAFNSVFTGNSASGTGGAISISSGGAKLVMDGCTVSGNTGNYAGGVYGRDTMLIDNCTISGNTANGSQGGGLATNTFSAIVTQRIRNSTISGNSAAADGGGIVLNHNAASGTFTVQNCTITGNTAGSGSGGGIARNTSLLTIAIESSVVSGNTNATAPDISSAGTVNVKTSAIGSNSGFTRTDLGGNLPFQAHSNLKLGSLQNNGGATLTHQPAFDSPLVDVGSNPAALTTDQRGTGFGRSIGLTTIGAIEEPVNLLVLNANDNGYGSLRQTILHANGKPGPDTITFDSSFFSSPCTILLNSTMSILEGVTITAPPALVTVNAQAKSRILSINPAIAGETVTISGLVLTNGKTAPGGGDGAGINNTDAHLSLNRVLVSSCFATNDPGGGINSGGTLVLTDCEIVGNRTKFDGGGINAGTLIMLNSTVHNNVADRAGGGIRAGNCTITNSTISDNDVTSDGSGGGGGGIAFYGSANIKNSSVAGNLSDGDFGGGGIWRSSGTGTLTLDSTIVASNAASNGRDIFFDVPSNVAGNNNLIGVANSGNFTLTGTGNLTGTTTVPLDAKLGSLTSNGGSTPTRSLLTGSPALNKGSNPANLTTDQRGVGFARNVNGVDIGAYEAQGPTTFVVTNNSDSGTGSLRQAILDSNNNAGTDTITFDPAFFGAPRTILLNNGLTIYDGVNIAAPSALVTIDAQSKTYVFYVEPRVTGDVVSISGLALVNGKGFTTFGGGIHDVDASLSLNRVTISNCGGGSGIYVQHSAAVVLTDCHISGNSASAKGGGIFFYSGGSSLTVSNSTISGNKAGTGSGGGIYFPGSVGAGGFSITNSTISGNSALGAGIGGGIYLKNFSGTALILNSTITANSAGTSGGGGIARVSGTGSVDLNSCILAGNLTSGPGVDLSFNAATNIAGNNNLIGVADSGNFTLTGTGNLTGTTAAPLNAKVAPLANNGGPTPTHALLSASPALSKGSNPANLTTDQRGAGFLRVGGAAIDIGSYEAQPATYVVTNANDNGAGSLRQALLNANAIAGLDTITFDPAFFNVPRIIALSTGGLHNTDEITIVGPGADLCTISGANQYRILDTQQAHGNLPVNISGLTFAFGQLFGVDDGAAIFAQDQKLSLSKCVFTSNAATRRGGAISMVIGSLTAEDCTFASNLATNNGGAISASTSDVTLRRCTISGNTAGNNGGGAYFYNVGTLLIEDCTLSSNQAGSASGGAVLNVRQGGTSQMIVRNSTISGNSAGSEGGGLATSSGVNLVVQNSTLSANSTDGVGGGIFGSAVIASSIVFGNQGNVAAPEMAATTATVSSSLIGSKSGVMTFNADSFTNAKLGVNPQIGPLQNNGGPTLTHALLIGSPAINNGANPAGLDHDQRGFARTIAGTPDIGAFELQLPPTVTSVVFGDGTNQRSLVKQIVVTFSEPVTFSGGVASAFTLSRTGTGGALGNVTLATTATSPTNSVTLTFSGSLTEFGSLVDGLYDFSISAAQVSGEGGALDGNNDGIAGGSYFVNGTTANRFFRYFGDYDGDGSVSQSPDFIEFRNAFGNASSIFDFDGDSAVDQDDFIKFRNNFGGGP